MNNSSSKSQLALKDDRSVTMAVDPAATAMTVQQVLGQVALIQQIMGAAMKDGEHYGKIPGCGDKPTLLKAGAEKLCLTFRLAPTYDVDERNVDRGHREYRVQCTLTSILSQSMIGQGVGMCSTLEAKYRFRRGEPEPTDKPVPRAYWDVRQDDPAKAQELIGGKGFTVKKVDGQGWMIARGGDKVEHDNPADHFNTVLKMAKKRALVDAVLTATAASDIFTQDLDDISANMAAAGSEAPHVLPPPPSAPEPRRENVPAARMSEEAAWNVKIPFGQHRGKPLKDLPEGSRAWFFDDWFRDTQAALAKGSHFAPGHLTLRDAILTLAPLSVDQFEPVDDTTPAQDFREVRIHFGKNRGLMLSELTPQQVHWYESDWMPKKEVNGPTSVEDLVLINALKAFRAWRQNERGE